MKWDEPPLWPVAVPSLVGFAVACIPYVIPNTPQLVGGELTTPFILLVIMSPSYTSLLSRLGEGRVDTRSQYWDVLRILSPSNILRLVHHSHPALASPVNVCLEEELPSFQNRDLARIRSSFWTIHRRFVWTPHPCLTRSSPYHKSAYCERWDR